MTRPVYDPAPLGGEPVAALGLAASTTWVRRLVEVVNRLLTGKINAVLDVTLTANSDTTDLIDARLSYYSALLFSPTSANAAVSLPTVWVSAQAEGTATLTHLKNAQTDRTYRVVIIG